MADAVVGVDFDRGGHGDGWLGEVWDYVLFCE